MSWLFYLCILALYLVGCGASQQEKRAKRMADEARRTRISSVSTHPTRTGVQRPVVTMHLRVYATPVYQQTTLAWKDAFKARLNDVHRVSIPELGVRFEVDSFHTWSPTHPEDDLNDLLNELEKHDDSQGTDRVVGLVAPFPTTTASAHDLGLARVLGRHILIRSSNDNADLNALKNSLDELDEEALLEVYTARKAYRERVLFLHEWAHTLGALHTRTRTSVMFPSMDDRQHSFSTDNRALIQAMLTHHTAQRPLTDSQSTQRQRALFDFITHRTQQRTEWSGRAVEWAQNTFSPSEDDAIHNALRAAQNGDMERAWKLFETRLGRLDADALKTACTVGANLHPEHAQRVCPDAIRANPRDLGPRLDLLRSTEDPTPETTQTVLDALKLHTSSPIPPPPHTTLRLSVALLRHNFPTIAASLLNKLPPSKDQARLQRAAHSLQARFGLPHNTVETTREPLYIETTRSLLSAMSNPSQPPLRKATSTFNTLFPNSPGSLLALCANALYNAPAKRALRTCKEPTQASPRYALGLFFHALSLQRNNTPKLAIQTLEQCVQLDPDYTPAWNLLFKLARQHASPKDLQRFRDLREHTTQGPPTPTKDTP